MSVPAGPVTEQRMRDAWSEILGRLEGVSRSSWMLASGAKIVSLDDDVLTLAFSSQNDVSKFKQLAAGKGPSEDLRQAIMAVLGIRVKYIARHEGGPGGGPGGGSGGAPTPPATPATPPPTARATSPRPVPAAAPASAAPVTEWAVAPIPSDADAPPPDPGPAAVVMGTPSQFAVDDEPEDAATVRAPARTATLAPVREGDILPQADVAPSIAREDEEELDDMAEGDVDAPVPPTVAPPIAPIVTVRNDGVQRYGEAVIRQVLGATFVREEPFQPPTRFS